MKKAISIILALMLTIGCVTMFASCGKEPAPEVTTAADGDETVTAEVPADDTTAAVDATDATPAEETTEAPAEETTEAAPEVGAVPSTTEEIVECFNTAVNGAAKAGYSKTRTTTVTSLEGGAIMKIKVAADAVKDFLGEGTKTYNNAKGSNKYMSEAKLSASDVTSATCTENGGKLTIALTLKDGSNAAGGSMSDNSPLNRCGLLVGHSDKSEYDYKTTENIYNALNGLDEASLGSGTGKTQNAKITLVIDAATGHVESMNVDFTFSVVLQNVKYLIAKIATATGSATTSVKFSGFAY